MAVTTSPDVRRPASRPPYPTVVSRVPGALATLVAVVAWACALLALVPLLRTRSDPVRVAAAYLAIPIRPNLAYAAFLGLIAASVRRRTRLSWWVVVLLYFGPALLGSLVGGVIEPPLFLSAAILSVLLAFTIAARSQFTARLEPGNGWRAAGTLAIGLVLATGLALPLVWLFPGTLRSGADRATWAIDHVFGGLGNGMSLSIPGRPPAAVTFLCGLFGGLAFVAAAWVLFRPTRSHAYLEATQERQIRSLLAVAGERDSLGYFATRRDKAATFSPSGKAAVTYRVVFGTSLASGDPIGDPEAWPQAIEAWLAEARSYAWAPAVLGASEDGAHQYVRAGLDALQLGDEAIVEVAEFTLDGRSMRGVRQAVRRIEKAGYRSRIRRHADLAPDEMAAVLARADAWRDTQHERGFSMALGRLGDPADGQCVLVEAIDADGELRALLSFVPWGTGGLSLDLMRRDRRSDNGLVEFMVVELVNAARRLSVERISLNFAMFREVFEEGGRIGAGPVIRLFRSVLLFVSRWWQLESLYRSNAKYRPDWEPRLLCFRSPRDLARISVAMGIAEGFLSVPTLAGLLRRGRAGPIPPATAGAGPQAAAVVDVVPAAPVTSGAPPLPAAVPEQMRVRRHKLERLRAEGVDPYPVGFDRTATVAQVRAAHTDLPADTSTGVEVAVAGRVMLNRTAGRLCFATIQDGTGRLQVMLSADRVGADALRRWCHDVDLGDHVGVRGEVVTTRRGELSIAAARWSLTAKCLRPLPDKHRGLHDPESRVRLRHVDLITNPAARTMLRQRSRVVAGLREFLADRGFLEVETPMLQRVHGGANARPFVTHINAYDMRLYLRIAPELYLKRLLVGGEERIFELNRNFRNEGVDASHNPEFTMLEAYQSYGDYETMLTLVREMIQHAATRAFGAPVARRARADGSTVEVDLGGGWPVRTVEEALSEALGEAVDADTPTATLAKLAERAGVHGDPGAGRAALVLRLYEHLVERRTERPTFFKDFPAEVAPLTRRHRADPRLAERWDLVAFGIEIGTAYSELTDPVEQRERLTAQSLLDARGDVEAMELDEDFLAALEYAMPPTGGLGVGVDRLLMMLTGASIRETVLFPFVRPHS
jgi:lysyl-tRNA synthetase class 2